MSQTNHSEIKLYIDLMQEVKNRIEIVNNIINGSKSTGSLETNIEFCCLQIRKILELISLGSLTMNKIEFERQSIKYQHFWNSKKILADIEKINPNFYPKPLIMLPIKDKNGSVPIIDMQSGFLSKEDFVEVYNSVNEILHADSPFREKTDFKEYSSKLAGWVNKIVKLINLHRIRLYKNTDFYLVYVYNAEGENVQAVHYPNP